MGRLWRALALFLVTAVGVPLSAVPAATVAIRPLAEGGVFYEAEPVRVRVECLGSAVPDTTPTLTVLDVENTTVTVRMQWIDRAKEEGKRWGSTVEIGPLPIGYYSVVDRGAGGFTKLAVIRPPHPVAAEVSPFGVDAFLAWRCGEQTMRRSAARTIRRAGISWVRDRLSWAETQPTSRTLAWGKYDDSLAAQREVGVSVLQIFHDIPQWSSSATTGTSETRRHVAPHDPLAASRYFETAARRWSRDVAAWELWNEFDIPVFFEGTPDEYASVMRSAALGVRRGNPQATILSGSTTLSVFAALTWAGTTHRDVDAERFVDRLLANQIGDCFDVWNMHYYGPPAGVVERIRQNRDLLRKHGLEDSRIWLTEAGHTATERMNARTEEVERRQADDLVKLCTLALSEGVERIFYFCWPNFFEHGASPWGLVEEQREQGLWLPKPAWAAYANLAYHLGGCEPANLWPSADEDVAAFAFAPKSGLPTKGTKDSSLVVAWSRSEYALPEGLKPPAGGWPDGTQVLDVYGRPLAVLARTDQAIALSSSPVFIVARGLAVRPGFPLSGTTPPAEKQRPVSIPGQVWCEISTPGTRLDFARSEVAASVRVINADTTARTLQLVVDAVVGEKNDFNAPAGSGTLLATKALSVPPQGVVEETVTCVFRGDLRLRAGEPVAMRASIRDPNKGGDILARTVRFLDVEVPVRVERTQLIDPAEFLGTVGEPVWTADLVSHTAARGEATVTVRPETPAGLGGGDGALKHLQRREVVRVPPSGAHVPVVISRLRDLKAAWDPRRAPPVFRIQAEYGGSVAALTARPEVGGIAPATRIDLFPPWTLEPTRTTQVIGRLRPDRQDDMRAEIRASWDLQTLHLDLRVADRHVMNPMRRTQPWLGDALEIFLDARDPDRVGTPGYDSRVFQIFVVPPDRFDKETTLEVWPPGGRTLSRSRAEGKVLPDEGRWEARVGLAWRDLGVVDPAAGRPLGIDFALDDLDPGDDTRRQIVWRGTADDWRDPTVFARVQLVGE